MPLWFSNDIEYWNPEHPPPTTPIRSPAGTGSCVAIISFTLVIAEGVKFTGAVEVGAPVTTSAEGVTVAVDIGQISLITSLLHSRARYQSGGMRLTIRCGRATQDA